MTLAPRFVLAGLLFATLLWGGSFVAIKIAVVTLDPYLVIFSRLLLATLLFIPLRRRLGPFHYRRGDWRLLGLMALCEPFLYFILETHALRLTSSAAAATVIALLPLAVALAAYYWLGEQPTPRLWQGLLLALVGALWLTWSSRRTELAPQPLLGAGLEFLAMLTAVGYTLAVKRLSVRYSAGFLTALQTVIGTILFLPFVLLRPAAWDYAALSWPAALAVLYLGAGVSILAYFLYNYALSRLPASQVIIYISLIPAFAALFGWLLLGEELGWLQGGAILLVAAGVATSQGAAPVRTTALAGDESG